MYVRQYLITVMGETKEDYSRTATLIHHRMFWKGKPSFKDLQRAEEDAKEYRKWSVAVSTGVCPLGGYWLWNSEEGVTPLGVKVSFADRCRNTRASLAHSVARIIRKFKLLKYTIYTSKK